MLNWLRTIAASVLLMGGAAVLSAQYVGYDRAGKDYIQKQREKRKSVRVGSPYYGHTPYASRGFRGGK